MPADITVRGRLTRDPEKKVTGSGKTMAVFGIANNERIQNQATKEWSDGDPMFLDCVAWNMPAELVLDNLGRGDLVIITGTLRQRWWETDDGQKRSKFEVAVRDVHGSLRKKGSDQGNTSSQASTYSDAPPF